MFKDNFFFQFSRNFVKTVKFTWSEKCLSQSLISAAVIKCETLSRVFLRMINPYRDTGRSKNCGSLHFSEEKILPLETIFQNH